jgi:glycosyltransferase involved in cell wall biosynthesis
MSDFPIVSVVMIFLDEERFIREAIESVINQKYSHWELLLVDDGSSDSSKKIAREFASQRPEQIYYLTHPGRENRGMSASRNVGIQKAKGKYIAFLDADDVWSPQKLSEQVAILKRHPDISMLYGETEYWFSWHSKNDSKNLDFVPSLRIPTDEPIKPPKILPLYLSGKTVVPCPSDIILQLEDVKKIGGFDTSFIGPYEDQAFYLKVSLEYSVMASSSRWFRYRQHSNSSMSIASNSGQLILSRKFFLKWARDYIHKKNVTDLDVWYALEREIWRIEEPIWLPQNYHLQYVFRWIRKWLLRVEEKVMPNSIRYRIWIKESRIKKSD